MEFIDSIFDFLNKALSHTIGSMLVPPLTALLAWFFARKPLKKFFARIFRKSGKSKLNICPLPEIVKEADRIKSKLIALRAKSDCPIVLVGCLYLDIVLRPIHTTTLAADEWSNVDPIRVELGGASLWVGRFLWEDCRRRSFILSIKGSTGGNNPLEQVIESLINREEWLNNHVINGHQPNSHSGVTVHLIQRGNKFTTMFTHRGVLVAFNWTDIAEKLGDVLSSGGLLFISGYMKTNLCTALSSTLQQFSPNTLICIDHGSIMRILDNPQAVRSLKDAFKQHLIDVYICTYNEIWNLCYFDDDKKNTNPPSGEAKKVLEKLAAKIELPFITIVRGTDIPGQIKAYVILGGLVYPIEGLAGQAITDSSVGAKNAFTAMVLHKLLSQTDCISLEDQVIEAGREALKSWHKHNK